MNETELAAVRAAYAKQVTFAGGVAEPSLERAFAEVRREHFLGPGPWKVFRWTGYEETPDADPARLYGDILIGIIPERGLNNGQPSGHATWIGAALPAAGEHVVHIGAGVGYYSAVMAAMVGPAGRVTAIEYDPGLAARAAANFADWPNVTVKEGNGATTPFDPADVIYVNAGVTRPVEAWLQRLKEGGRLILPMTTHRNFRPGPIDPANLQGAIFRIERRRNELLARAISGVAIFPCEGVRDDAAEQALRDGFAAGGIGDVTRLYLGEDIPPERTWASAQGWTLGCGPGARIAKRPN